MCIFKLLTQQGHFGNFTDDEFPFPMFCISLAGWIGNDAISPIIGEHDPYYHVTSRVKFLHQQGYFSNFTYINSPFFIFFFRSNIICEQPLFS